MPADTPNAEAVSVERPADFPAGAADAPPMRKARPPARAASKRAADKKSAKALKPARAAKSADVPVAPKPSRERKPKPEELLAEMGPDEKAKLEQIASQYASIGRKDVAQTFAVGDLICQAAAILPSGTTQLWVERNLGISARQGRNYTSVVEKLGPWRQRLLAQAVHPSTLYAMASAEPDQVEAVVAAFEAGEQPRHKDVAKALAAPKAEKAMTEPADVGGPAGLRALAAAKASLGIKQFGDGIAAISETVSVALETAGTKRVEKRVLAQAVEMPARQCAGELANLALFVRPLPRGAVGHVEALEFTLGTGWHGVAGVLARLAAFEHWPASAELRSWLRDDVLPALHWVLGKPGGAMPGRGTVEAEPQAGLEVEPEIAVEGEKLIAVEAIVELASENKAEIETESEIALTAALASVTPSPQPLRRPAFLPKREAAPAGPTVG